jgi:hypothetical protein
MMAGTEQLVRVPPPKDLFESFAAVVQGGNGKRTTTSALDG